MSKSIVVLAYHFPPADSPGTFRSYYLSKYLPQFGYKSEVYAHLPKQLESKISNDAGMVNVHYDRPGFYENLCDALKKIKLFRLFWYVFFFAFFDPALGYAYRIYLRLKRRGKNDTSLIYSSSGPWATLLVAWLLKKRWNIPWVADFRDVYTDGYQWLYPSKIHWWITRYFEKWMIANVDHLIVTTQAAKKLYVERGWIAEHKITVIYNGSELNLNSQNVEAPQNISTRKEPIIVTFAGTLNLNRIQKEKATTIAYVAQKIKHLIWTYRHNYIREEGRSAEPLFKAVSVMKSRSKIQLYLFGRIDSAYLNLARQLDIASQVIIEGMKSKKETQRLLKQADLLYLPLERMPEGKLPLYLPGKLFEYIFLRKKILAYDEESELRDILKEEECGLFFNPDDVQSLADILDQLCENPHLLKLEKSPQFEKYSAVAMAKKIATLFDRVIQDGVN